MAIGPKGLKKKEPVGVSDYGGSHPLILPNDCKFSRDIMEFSYSQQRACEREEEKVPEYSSDPDHGGGGGINGGGDFPIMINGAMPLKPKGTHVRGAIGQVRMGSAALERDIMGSIRLDENPFATLEALDRDARDKEGNGQSSRMDMDVNPTLSLLDDLEGAIGLQPGRVKEAIRTLNKQSQLSPLGIGKAFKEARGNHVKVKRLARGGMEVLEGTTSHSTELGEIKSYLSAVKGNGSEQWWDEEDSRDIIKGLPETSTEGEEISCVFEREHYEEVLSHFRQSSVLLHFLGRPPSEAELKKWLQHM